jgi:hypothetical protein
MRTQIPAKPIQTAVLFVSVLAVDLCHPGLAYDAYSQTAGVSMNGDFNREMVSTGDVDPYSAISHAIYSNCDDVGCHQGQYSFQARSWTDDATVNSECGKNTISETCTVTVDSLYHGHTDSILLGQGLLQSVKQDQESSKEILRHLTADWTCPDRANPKCSRRCIPPIKSESNWRIPSYKRVGAWLGDGAFLGYVQYSISCQANPLYECPGWLGTATQGAMIYQNPIVQIVGGIINFVCQNPPSRSSIQESTIEESAVQNRPAQFEWDRSKPLASMPKNCQDGGWRNATKQIWETKYRNCPFPT